MYEIELKHKIAALIAKRKLFIDSSADFIKNKIRDEFKEIYNTEDIIDTMQVIYFESHEQIITKNEDDECYS